MLGKSLDEARTFQIAHAYEQSTDWHKARPKQPTSDNKNPNPQLMNKTIDPEVAAQHAEIDRKAQVARENQLRLAQLTKAVTACEAELVEFESKKSFLQSRKQQLQDQLLSLWPKQASDLSLQVNTSPLQCIVESHGTIAAIDAAIAAAPRVKQYLDEQLRVAKQKLDEFSKRAPK